MCSCQLIDGVHWFVDKLNAPYMFMVAETPEQAERSLRTWAAKTLRLGNMHLDMRPIAARVLSLRILHMVACCSSGLFHPHNIDL